MEHSHYLKFRRLDMVAFRKVTKGMLCDDIYIHMWNLIRKEFEEYSQIPPADTEYGDEWLKDGKRHRLFDLPSYERKNNLMTWAIDGKRHRDWDLPAFISLNGRGGYNSIRWYKNDELHRDTDEPADIHYLLSYWYKHGVINREGDKPAVVSIHGDMWWMQNNKLYREGDKPTIIKRDGTQIWATSEKNWWLPDVKWNPEWKGQRKFQIDPDGTMRWFINNQPGRLNDEPAVIYPNGTQVWCGYVETETYHSGVDFYPVIHRGDGKPAIICKDGSMTWYYRGKIVACVRPGRNYGKPKLYKVKIGRGYTEPNFAFVPADAPALTPAVAPALTLV